MFKRSLLIILILVAKSLTTQAFQVVITELLPDPEPPLGLPPEEFVELTNVSGKIIHIGGWSIANGRTTAIIPDSITLSADEIIILCSNSAAGFFNSFGKTIGLSKFPALSNLNDTIILRDSSGEIIHAVAYTSNWYSDQWPAPGRSLEMIGLTKSCTLQNNWAASKSVAGGTPGQANLPSVNPNNEQHFTLLYTYLKNETELVLVFDDAIETPGIDPVQSIETNPRLEINSCRVQGLLKNELACTITQPLPPNQVFEIEANGIRSCLLYPPGGTRRVKAGRPGQEIGQLVISEILFDPPGEGADYLELYNASNKIINLQEIDLANRNSAGEIASRKALSTIPRYIFPGEWLVFTTMPAWVGKQFHVRDPANVIQVPSLPSWPNEQGTVLLLNRADSILDELAYDAGWHFELIRNTEGVALERKDYTAATQSGSNWLSAAASAGYGTPGYANSQSGATAMKGRQVWPEPTVFTPNQDGREDLCQLKYQFDRPGILLTTRIYNRNGQLVRTLANNALCGLSGSYEWDGKDDKKNQLPPNIYVVVTDIFSLDGDTRRYRHAVTMGY